MEITFAFWRAGFLAEDEPVLLLVVVIPFFFDAIFRESSKSRRFQNLAEGRATDAMWNLKVDE